MTLPLLDQALAYMSLLTPNTQLYSVTRGSSFLGQGDRRWWMVGSEEGDLAVSLNHNSVYVFFFFFLKTIYWRRTYNLNTFKFNFLKGFSELECRKCKRMTDTS